MAVAHQQAAAYSNAAMTASCAIQIASNISPPAFSNKT